MCSQKLTKGRRNLAHGTKNGKNKEGTIKKQKPSSSKETAWVIVCEGSPDGRSETDIIIILIIIKNHLFK